MSLKQRLQDDVKEAMRAKDKDRLGTLRLILAAIKQREVDERIELDDGQTLLVLDKMLKQRRESIAQFTSAGREDLAAKEQAEVGVIQGYMTEENYTTGYSTAPGFLGIKAQSSLDNRYLTEDVGYSLVLFTDLARSLGVSTPVMDAVVQIASVVLARDFRAEAARTMQSLGLADLSRDELGRY